MFTGPDRDIRLTDPNGACNYLFCSNNPLVYVDPWGLLDDFETFIFETFIDVGYIGDRFCKDVARRGRIIGRKLKYGSDIVLGTGKNMIVTGPGIAMDGVRKSKDMMAEGIQLSFDMTGIGWAALHDDIASHKPISRTLKSFTEHNVDPDQLRFEIAWFTLKFVGTVGLEPLARAEGNAFGEASVTGDYAKAAAVNEMLLVFSAFAKSARGPRAMTKARAPRVPKNAVAPKNAPKVNMGKQGKHIPGHNNYTPGRSVLKANPNQLAKKAGTGQRVGKVPRGQPGFKERVDFGEVIGDFVENGSGTPTTKGIITYAKDGSIHIIPARP